MADRVPAARGERRGAGVLVALAAWMGLAALGRKEDERAAVGDAERRFRAWTRPADPSRAAATPSDASARAARELERAHAARRRGEEAEALRRYEELAWSATDPRTRERAAYWRARLHEIAGRATEAARAWELAAELARDPCARIRVADRLALARIALGDRAAAARVLAASRAEHARRADEASEHGARVAHTLARMRAPRALGLVAWPEREPSEHARSGSLVRKKVRAPPLDCSQGPP